MAQGITSLQVWRDSATAATSEPVDAAHPSREWKIGWSEPVNDSAVDGTTSAWVEQDGGQVVALHGRDEVAGAPKVGGDNGLSFQLDILQECQRSVQAFLEDADSVLSALDQCQAEEKCLMLIKRPKDTARKMLKSHSWANLSVSEPQLFRQFNGVSLGQTEPVTYQPYMMRRSSDQQSVTSCETDRSDGRRRYVTARGKENLRRQGQRSLSDSTNDNYQLLSDATSVACDYHADRKGERIREHSRREKLYPSIPEDEQEINNNNNSSSNNNNGYNNNSSVLGNSKSHGLVYHSCMDITQASLPTNGHSDWSRQGGKRQTQGQRVQGQGQREREHMPPQRQAFNGVHDPGDLDDGSRSQSLGNLSTGLTLSLVGQRKADSMLDLSLPARHSHSHLHPHPHPHPSSASSKNCRSEGSFPGRLRNSGESGSDNVLSPTDSYPEVFSPREAGTFNYSAIRSPPQPIHNGSYSSTTHPSHRGGYRSYNNSHAFSPSREQTTTPGDHLLPPQKPKRSLPQVPAAETSEKIKRFTEIMRSRMSISSSSNGGRSTDNSVNSQTSVTSPRTPTSRHASLADNASDVEVSTLLDGGPGEGGALSSQQQTTKRGREQHPSLTPAARVKDGEGRGRLPPPHPHSAAWSRRPSVAQETPQGFADHSSSESNQTPFTSHSHSSTMDSGYTTNTEGDGDSVSQLSPPHPSVHRPAADARPIPAPRNPALAAARKYNSLQNVSNLHRHGNSLQPHPHQFRQNGYDVVSSGRGPPDPGPMRALPPDLTCLPTDHRRSWDLAQNFKSLDFKPVAEGFHRERRPSSPEEVVVRPQAVVVNTGPKQVEGSGIVLKNSVSKINGVVNGNDAADRGSVSADRAEQRQVSERHSANTLPGHWKYTASSTTSESSSQRSRSAALVAPPTLFQLSQNYGLCSVKLNLPVDTTVKDILTLTTVQVALPGMAADGGRSLPSESRQVQLGGPGSAFRPVRTSAQATIGMAGVGSLQDKCSQLCAIGDLKTGDILVELNGWYCLNSDHQSLQRVLENCQGEVTLTIARRKEEAVLLREQQLEGCLQFLESEVTRLKEEMSKKDSRIQELSAMAVWKKASVGSDKVLLEPDEGAFVIGDNEFVV